jgi:NADPH:quinone reductase-like Zn-dependent oxidoreductase
MRQVWITRKGPPEVLQVREAPDPTPGPGEVRVRVAACGVNFADLMMRLGLYPDGPPLPAVPGYEIAGTIDEVGAGVSGERLGQEVLAVTRFGGYTDLTCLPAGQAYPRPPSVSAQTGAALPVNYLTAYQMIEVMGGLREEQVLLVHGAAGGVGLAAVQLGRLRGARIFGSASPAKHEFLRRQGVELVLDSGEETFAPAVRAATGGQGADLVLEPRHGRWIRESYRCLARTGRLVLFGFASAAAGERPSLRSLAATLLRTPWFLLNPIRIMNDNAGVLGVNLGRMWDQGERLDRWLRQLLAMLADGLISPHVDRTFPLAEAATAHRYLHERRNIGKVLLACPKPSAAAGPAPERG